MAHHLTAGETECAGSAAGNSSYYIRRTDAAWLDAPSTLVVPLVISRGTRARADSKTVGTQYGGQWLVQRRGSVLGIEKMCKKTESSMELGSSSERAKQN